VNRFVIRDAGDIENQELFVERLGDFIVAKYLPLEHRWSEAAADSQGNCSCEEAQGRPTHAVTELPFWSAAQWVCGLRRRLRSHGNDEERCSSLDRIQRNTRVRIIGRGFHRSCLHPVRAEDHAHSDTEDQGR